MIGIRDILAGADHSLVWSARVCTELKNRGAEDVLMAACSGPRLPAAINTVWSRTVGQTCVVHLRPNSCGIAAGQHRDTIAIAPNRSAAGRP
ncbi:transposase [Dactylosporangium sp. CA-152071]|uniref:transposase n=1 Tax=Dactylosporangium sp. CA-152071 TaxID=3239933 RepID=UPI003D905476